MAENESFYVDIGKLSIADDLSLDEKVNTLLNHVMLQNEFNRWQMYNIGTENMTEGALHEITDPVYVKLEDVEAGLNTKLLVTAEGLQLELDNAVAGLETKISVSAAGLQAQIGNVDGRVTNLSVTVNGLTSTVSGLSGNVSQISQKVNNITLSVSNGSTSSTINLNVGGTIVSSPTISFEGYVTFRNLSRVNSDTVINGGNITTGTINASSVNVLDSFRVYDSRGSCGYMGAGSGSDGVGGTRGVLLEGSSASYYLIVTGSGVRMQTPSTSFFCSNSLIKASEPIDETSDQRVKKDIAYDMERYEDFFMALKPCYYRRVDGTSGRYHTGYIAQEIEEALEGTELTTMDFAALVKDPHAVGYSEEDPEYSLRYSEFTALNTAMIQRLYRRVEELEAQVKQL